MRVPNKIAPASLNILLGATSGITDAIGRPHFPGSLTIPAQKRECSRERNAGLPGPIRTTIYKQQHTMKTRTVAFSFLAIIVLVLGLGGIYQLGFTHGGAYERLHCSARPILKGTVHIDQAHGVNLLRSPYSP